MSEEDDSPLALSAKRARDSAVDSLVTLAKFWRTRKALLRNEPLHDLVETARRSNGYLSPWRFAATAVLIQGTLAALVGFCVDFLFGSRSRGDDGIFYVESGLSELDTWVALCGEWIKPFWYPMLFTLLMTIFTRGFLYPYEITKTRLRRARIVLLYCYGTYGFWSLVLFALWDGTERSYLFQSLFDSGIAMIGGHYHGAWSIFGALTVVVLILSWLYLVYCNWWLFPRQVFLRLGGSGPWARFYFFNLISSPLAALVTFLVMNIAAYAIAFPPFIVTQLLLR